VSAAAVEGRPATAAAVPPDDAERPEAESPPETARSAQTPGAPEPPQFPVQTLDEGLAHLRRPFTKEAIRFKIQNVFKDAAGCQVVGYIDARLASERLNYVIGSRWHDDYEPLANGLMLCRLTVDGVTRQDVGSGYQGKGLYSDALKRAAVKFGVGQPVYALPQVLLWERQHGKGEDKPGWIERYELKGKPSLRLTEAGQAALRNGYEKWLAETGIHRFGEPIEHGDLADSAGEEPEAEASADDVSDLPAVQLPLTDAQADGLRVHCRTLYERVDGRRLPLARFESELRQASVSHEQLEAFAQKLEELAK
jgi:hypothetical protein